MPDLPDFEEEEALRLTLSPPGFMRSHERPQSSEASSEEPEKKARRIRQSSAERSSAAAAPTKPKEERIAPAYPWATDRRAFVHSLDFLKGCGIATLHGEVVCKRCDGSQMFEVAIESSLLQVNNYFMANRDTMHDRAPKCWTAPRLLDCTMCLQNDCVKPVIHAKKRSINWLFLLLTQTLGLCTLDQLKYFCKHTRRHRTGAKDRVLYLTYVGLLKQLSPSGPYE